MSEASMGKKKSKSHIENIILGKLANPRSAEAKKISAQNRKDTIDKNGGVKMSKESNKKRSESIRLRKISGTYKNSGENLKPYMASLDEVGRAEHMESIKKGWKNQTPDKKEYIRKNASLKSKIQHNSEIV